MSGKRKFIFNLQSKGSVGKSFEQEARICSFYDHYQIKWNGTDLDERHQNLSRRHPDETTLMEISDINSARDVIFELYNIILENRNGIFILDTKAQADEIIIDAFNTVDFLRKLKENNIESTQIIIPVNDDAALRTLHNTVRHTYKYCDYVIAVNQMHKNSKEFFNSRTHRFLVDLKGAVPVINIPFINDEAMNVYRSCEKTANGMSFTEMARYRSGGRNELGPKEDLAQFAFDHFLVNMRTQYGKIAEYIVDEGQLTKIKPVIADSQNNETGSDFPDTY